jgi:hypothetical protein
LRFFAGPLSEGQLQPTSIVDIDFKSWLIGGPDNFSLTKPTTCEQIVAAKHVPFDYNINNTSIFSWNVHKLNLYILNLNEITDRRVLCINIHLAGGLAHHSN